jgi:hypothetical protein
MMLSLVSTQNFLLSKKPGLTSLLSSEKIPCGGSDIPVREPFSLFNQTMRKKMLKTFVSIIPLAVSISMVPVRFSNHARDKYKVQW